jgi:hypothetical protein
MWRLGIFLPTASKDFSLAAGYLLATRSDNVHLEGLINLQRERVYMNSN